MTDNTTTKCPICGEPALSADRMGTIGEAWTRYVHERERRPQRIGGGKVRNLPVDVRYCETSAEQSR